MTISLHLICAIDRYRPATVPGSEAVQRKIAAAQRASRARVKAQVKNAWLISTACPAGLTGFCGRCVALTHRPTEPGRIRQLRSGICSGAINNSASIDRRAPFPDRLGDWGFDPVRVRHPERKTLPTSATLAGSIQTCGNLSWSGPSLVYPPVAKYVKKRHHRAMAVRPPVPCTPRNRQRQPLICETGT